MSISDRLYTAALQIASDADIRVITTDGMVWLLTEEAAWTARHFRGPPGRWYPGRSMWPEFREDDFFAVERERLADGVEGDEPKARVQPSAAQISRYEEMRSLWNRHAFRRLGSKAELRKAVWLYAMGWRPAKIRQKYGISRQRLHNAKNRGCDEIADFLGWNAAVDVFDALDYCA